MIFFCETCQQTYELNRSDIRCIYCGAYTCPASEMPNHSDE